MQKVEWIIFLEKMLMRNLDLYHLMRDLTLFSHEEYFLTLKYWHLLVVKGKTVNAKQLMSFQFMDQFFQIKMEK